MLIVVDMLSMFSFLEKEKYLFEIDFPHKICILFLSNKYVRYWRNNVYTLLHNNKT